MIENHTIKLSGGTRLELGQDGETYWLKTVKNGVEKMRSELSAKALVFLVEKAGTTDDTICLRHGLVRQRSAVTWCDVKRRRLFAPPPSPLKEALGLP